MTTQKGWYLKVKRSILKSVTTFKHFVVEQLRKQGRGEDIFRHEVGDLESKKCKAPELGYLGPLHQEGRKEW